jgi:hypothetical protein
MGEARDVWCSGELCVYRDLVGKPGGERPPRRPGVGCTHLAQDRDTCWAPVNMVMTLRVHG